MSAAETVGVDLGGTKVFVGVYAGGTEPSYEDADASVGRGEDELLELLEQRVRAAIDARPGVEAVGLGIPCTIDRERGVAINAVNLDITDVPIRDRMRERLGLPVFIDNDANVAALAEHRFGVARDATNAVVLTIGTGIGGGLIIDGAVYRGTTGAGAELGHMVVEIDGPPCQGTCPNRGCLEAVASGTAIGREGAAAAASAPHSELGRRLEAGEQIDGRVVTEAAQTGDETAIGVLAEVGRRLGAGLSGLANIFEPDVIVIGGGAIAAGELLLGPAREELRARALPPQNRTPVEAAALGPAAGVIGAAAMAAEELAA